LANVLETVKRAKNSLLNDTHNWVWLNNWKMWTTDGNLFLIKKHKLYLLNVNRCVVSCIIKI